MFNGHIAYLPLLSRPVSIEGILGHHAFAKGFDPLRQPAGLIPPKCDAEFILYSFFFFNLRLFATTETELKAIAAPAIIGFNRKPVKGKSTPAAIGIARTL